MKRLLLIAGLVAAALPATANEVSNPLGPADETPYEVTFEIVTQMLANGADPVAMYTDIRRITGTSFGCMWVNFYCYVFSNL